MIEFPLSLVEYGILLLIMILGAILQGSAGFGLGLFTVPLLVLLEPRFVPGPLLGAALILNLLIFIRERKSVDFRGVQLVIVGRAVGSIAGAGVLALLPRNTFSLFLGFLVLLAVGLSLSGFRLSQRRENLLALGSLSGFMATTTAIGGPPLALMYQHESGNRLRGNLSAIFFAGILISLISLRVVGRLGSDELWLSLSLVPGVLIGFWISGRGSRALDRGRLRSAVLVISGLSAISVILKTIL